MDEPVEPPFTPVQNRTEEFSSKKLIVEMPFNNDITFPIPMVAAETIGELRRRIATTIGVDPSRVLISKKSPALPSDISVESAVEDNKLQLVVRSSFDFEKLRQLIEADRFSPILPPERTRQMPSPLNSPEIGIGFPWRSSTSLVSPRRPRSRRVLRIKVKHGMTLEFDAPSDFQQQNESLLISPELYAKIQDMGINKDPVAYRRQVFDTVARGFEEGGQLLLRLRARGLHQAVAITLFTTLLAHAGNLSYWPRFFLILAVVTISSTLMLYRDQFDFDWPTVARLPPVYAESNNLPDLVAKIPSQYKDNEDLSEEVQAEIRNAMRIRTGWFGVIKILLISLFPSIYESWVRQITTREEAHRIAVKMATEMNIERRRKLEEEEAEKAKQDIPATTDSAPSSSLTPPTSTSDTIDPVMHTSSESSHHDTPDLSCVQSSSPTSQLLHPDTASASGSQASQTNTNPFLRNNPSGAADQSH